MKIVDEKLLHKFRLKTRCELCLKVWPVDPHHLLAKGMGGGSRLDHKLNLISLCRKCHTLFHAGRIPKVDLLEVVGKREGLTVDEIETEIYRLLRAKK